MMEEKMINETKRSLSRRDFLVKAGALTAGMAVAGGLLGSASVAVAAPTDLPFPFKATSSVLDLERVRKRGYDYYFSKGGCMSAAAVSLLDELRSTGAGDIWNSIPDDLFKYGAGGVNSWGTLCGALNGALYILQLAMGPGPDFDKAANEILAWYTRFPFPSSTSAKYDHYAISPKHVTTVSYSPLCHNSVSRWCKEASSAAQYNRSVGVASNEKKDRCAKLSGDVAAKAALLLNQWKAGKLTAVALFSSEVNYCFSCHAPNNVNTGYPKQDSVSPNYKDDEQGKMECNECHGDEHNTAGSGSSNIHIEQEDCIVCHDINPK